MELLVEACGEQIVSLPHQCLLYQQVGEESRVHSHRWYIVGYVFDPNFYPAAAKCQPMSLSQSLPMPNQGKIKSRYFMGNPIFKYKKTELLVCIYEISR